jgi:hypothetical protein
MSIIGGILILFHNYQAGIRPICPSVKLEPKNKLVYSSREFCNVHLIPQLSDTDTNLNCNVFLSETVQSIMRKKQ